MGPRPCRAKVLRTALAKEKVTLTRNVGDRRPCPVEWCNSTSRARCSARLIGLSGCDLRGGDLCEQDGFVGLVVEGVHGALGEVAAVVSIP